ncbi:hypothetical protein T484DRAFT_1755133 [Baffinella frigidus]|nr:hypothetical protein T484DRAFT_1755133 [Cryptophyta sp. CCMP2293]
MSKLAITRLKTISGAGSASIDQSEMWCLLFVLNRGGVLGNEDPWDEEITIVQIPPISIGVLESSVETPDVAPLSTEAIESSVEIPDVAPLSTEALESPVEIPDVAPLSTEALESPVEIPDVSLLSIEVVEPAAEIPHCSPLSIHPTEYSAEIFVEVVESPVEILVEVHEPSSEVAGSGSVLAQMQSSYAHDAAQFDLEISEMLNGV